MTSAPRFYVLGTKYGRTRDVLPRMVLDGVVSTGFVDALDLTPIVGQDYAVARDWVQNKIPDESGVAKNTLARFAAMNPGDLVAIKAHSAPHGDRARLVIARYAVITGDRRPTYARSDALGHTLKADFLDEQEPLELQLGYGQTLHAIEDQDRIRMIFGEYANAAQATAAGATAQDKPTHDSEVAARGAYLMHRVHNALQNELRKLLVTRYGEAAVTQEQDFVDLLVRLDHKTLLFEVKSSPSPVACVREAIGQLLQYSWKLGLGGASVQYVVVGPSAMTAIDSAFLAHIARESKLPLAYRTLQALHAGEA